MFNHLATFKRGLILQGEVHQSRGREEKEGESRGEVWIYFLLQEERSLEIPKTGAEHLASDMESHTFCVSYSDYTHMPVNILPYSTL